MPDDTGAQTTRFMPRLLGSVVVHLLLLVLVFFSPTAAPPALPVMVTIDLVASLPAPPAAKRPAPAPAPKPRPVVQKKIVLPKKAPDPVVKPNPKPKPPKRAARVERPQRPKREPVLDYEDALDLLRVEQGEERPSVEPDAAAATAESTGVEARSGVPGQVDPWQLAASRHVQARWITPQEFLDRGLVTILAVELAADGTVIGMPRVTGPSGDPFWDDNTLRAIRNASPLPPPPEPGERLFVFEPQ